MVLIKYSFNAIWCCTVRPGGWYTVQTTMPESGLGRRLGRRISHKRELKINDAATPRRGVNMYDKRKVFWNLMSVTTV